MDKLSYTNAYFNLIRTDFCAALYTFEHALKEHSIKLNEEDARILSLCKDKSFEPCFRNLKFIACYLSYFIEKYPICVSYLYEHDPFVSSCFIPNLLTFNFIINECKENY